MIHNPVIGGGGEHKHRLTNNTSYPVIYLSDNNEIAPGNSAMIQAGDLVICGGRAISSGYNEEFQTNVTIIAGEYSTGSAIYMANVDITLTDY